MRKILKNSFENQNDEKYKTKYYKKYIKNN